MLSNSGLLRHGDEPDEKWARIGHRAICAALVLVCAILPSFKLAGVWKKPFSFTLPATVSAGGTMTFPASNDFQALRIGGLEPTRIEGKDLFFVGFGLEEKAVDLWAFYKTEKVSFPLRMFYSPPVFYSSQTIQVEALKAEEKTTSIRLPSSVAKRIFNEDPDKRDAEAVQTKQILSREDGTAKLACWALPLVSQTTAEFGTHRTLANGEDYFHLGVDIHALLGTAIKAAAPGETAFADELTVPGKMVVIYHGGGLYTRYLHLQEFQTHVGEKLASGQLIGFSGASGRAEAPHLHWEVLWKGKNLSPLEVLKLSQELCPPTKTKDRQARHGGPLVDQTPARSPASALQLRIHRRKRHRF